MTTRRTHWCFLACAAAQVLAFVGGLFISGPHFHARLDGDLKLYTAASAAILRGYVPYRDFQLEYPPGALIAFLGPRIFGGASMSRESYAIAFAAQNAILSIACMLLAAKLASTRLSPSPSTLGEGRGEGRAPRATMVLYTTMAILGSALFPYRFDLFPTFLTLASLSLAIHNRHALSALLLALGVLAKLYPLVLFPLLLTHALRHRAATRFTLAFSLTIAAGLIPFLAIAGTKSLSFLTYHKERGIQIESLPGAALCLAHVTGLSPVSVSYDHGALHLQSAAAHQILRFQTAAVPIALLMAAGGLSLWLFRCQENAALLPASIAMLLLFILTNKVFSPQFLIWLLPFIAILRGRTARAFLLAWALTLLVYPFLYAALRDLSPMVVGLVNLRNLSAVMMLAVLMAEHVRRRADGRPAAMLELAGGRGRRYITGLS